MVLLKTRNFSKLLQSDRIQRQSYMTGLKLKDIHNI